MKVLFSPETPWDWCQTYSPLRVIQYMGWERTDDADDPDVELAFMWLDETWHEPDPQLVELSVSLPVWNLECRDVSKRRVEQVFARVFGYTTFVDPTGWRGPLVVKHDENCHRFGVRRVHGPVDHPVDDLVYQRYIDSAGPGRLLDYRVPVVNGTVPYVHLYERVEDPRWMKNDVVTARVRDAPAVLTDDEIGKILTVCHELRLDYGELDLQRDRRDRRLFLLDVNKTPDSFLPAETVWESPEDAWRSIERLSHAVADAVDATRPHGDPVGRPPRNTRPAMYVGGKRPGPVGTDPARGPGR